MELVPRTAPRPRYRPSPPLPHPLPVDENVFRQCDILFEKVGDPFTLDMQKDKWAISASSASPFLEDCLPNFHRAKGHFRFMDLPPELRVMIYEEVFIFPQSGVLIMNAVYSSGNSDDRGSVAGVVSRDWDGPTAIEYWPARADLPQYSPLLQESHLEKRLALLEVDHQVSKEAMPVVLGINNFLSPNTQSLNRFLITTPSHRRDNITHISFKFSPRGTASKANLAKSFKILKNMPHLTHLDIAIDEEAWLEEKQKDGTPKFASFKDITGLDILRSMRGLKQVTIHGDADNIREYLVPDMTKPKVEEAKKARAPRKCKIAAVSYEEGYEEEHVAPVSKRTRAAAKKATTGGGS